MLSKRDPVLSSNSVNNGFLLYIAIISSDQFALLKTEKINKLLEDYVALSIILTLDLTKLILTLIAFIVEVSSEKKMLCL